MRLLLTASADGGPITPPAVLILGSVPAAMIGAAVAPFAFAGSIPTAFALGAFAALLAILLLALAAWGALRRRV